VRSTTRWLVHLALPYALLFAVDPISDLPLVLRRHLPSAHGAPELRGLVIALTGMVVWIAGTLIAQRIVARWGLRMR
jgi:hypothetical protein